MNKQVNESLLSVLSELNKLLEVMEETNFEGCTSLPKPLNNIENVEDIISELTCTLL